MCTAADAAFLAGFLLMGVLSCWGSPPSDCDLNLCTCTSGSATCARNLTGIYMQYPDCFEHCFKSCCHPSEAPTEVVRGRCTVPRYVVVLTEPFNGPVGLVEACPGIYLAAVDGPSL